MASKRFVVQLLDASRPPDGLLWSSSFDSLEEARTASSSALGAERDETVRERIEQHVIDTETNERWERTGSAAWEQASS